MQLILAVAHWFLYSTWIAFHPELSPQWILALRILLTLLAISFIAAALLSFRSSGWVVSVLYRLAAVWLGLLNFFFLAACLSWISDFALRILHMDSNRPLLADLFFGFGALVAVYGLFNARFIRLRRITVSLRNLPESWHGRTGMLVSDLHLGPVNGSGFCGKIAKLALLLKPEIIFIAGDLFDGTKTDPAKMIAPLKQLDPLLGIYYSTGNHDEFGNVALYNAVLEEAGIHVLENRMVIVDGMQIAGVNFGDTNYPLRLRMLLDGLALDPDGASILLNHVPNRLPIVEGAGVGLQLSGHTHGGQLLPFTWFTRRAFGKFTYGLQKFGNLQVYTSSGAGTWGPPMRVGTAPEVVLLRFE